MRFPWPKPFQCAAVLSFDVDAESAYVFSNPDKAGAQLAGMEERRFGVRTGIARILRLLDTYGLRATFFVPGYTIEHHTDAVRTLLRAGHEMGAHGNVHETLDTLSPSQEEQVLKDQLAIWQQYLNLRPQGYRSPSWELNVGTPALLKRCSGSWMTPRCTAISADRATALPTRTG
jgi:peptidoglycan/xylan/chitin deacetylase (PgdA/CDA1 family)